MTSGLGIKRDAEIERLAKRFEKPELKKQLSADDIQEMIAAMAQQGDGADKRWALKVLQSQQISEAVLPPLLNDAEVIERLMRVMRPAGKETCQLAYRRCWPHRGIDGIKERPAIREADITEEQQMMVERVVSLKTLYKHFPEIKRPGFPKGYPTGRGLEAQRDWCRRKAVQCLVDREQAALDNVSIADVGKVKDDLTDHQPTA